MKQSFYAIGIVILLARGEASAQTTETSFTTKSAPTTSTLVTGHAPAAGVEKISITALERFSKQYKDAKDAVWAEIPNGYRVSFLQDAVLTAVDYTKKGKLYSVIRYGKHLLTANMKSLLAIAFDDIQIREVAEVKLAEFSSPAYVVLLEDRMSLKTIQIIDDEMSVIQEVNKRTP